MLKTQIAVKALIKNGDKFLILKNKDSDLTNPFAGWETPGGRLNDGEEIMAGLNRELREETGLVVDVLFPFNAYSGSTKLEDAIIGINYLANYVNGDVVMDPNEHIEYKWATMAELRELKDSVGLQLELDAYEKFLEKIKN